VVRREWNALADAQGYLTDEGPRILLEGLLVRGKRVALAALRARERALQRRWEAVQGDRAEAREWLVLEGLGQALLAGGDLRRRGESSRRVTDYTRNPPAEVELPLEPALTVLENAQRLFKRAKRGQARLNRTGEILEAIEAEQTQLSGRVRAIESCGDLNALYPAAGRTKPGSPARDGKAKLPRGVSRLELPRDFVGFAGKSAQGNDAVSFRMGRGEDFWFHAEDYAGCHVVVKNPNRRDSLPLEVEQAAALHAAERSAAPPGNRVAVTVARCKNLRRVPGALGRVWVSKPRTVFVDLPARR
jgi:predicted ribosome quality control (RQC) complex YloA/Tae2 family protein